MLDKYSHEISEGTIQGKVVITRGKVGSVKAESKSRKS